LEPHVVWAITDRRDFFYLEPDTRERMAREQGSWLEYIDKLRAKRDAAQLPGEDDVAAAPSPDTPTADPGGPATRNQER
jgi:hypothetical protein